jgi:hypothetical protein
MLTIEQIAEKLGMKYQDVYGFVNFLKLLGAASDSLPPKSGKKGKPARLYSFAPNALDLVGQWIANVERESIAMRREALEREQAELNAKLATLTPTATETPVTEAPVVEQTCTIVEVQSQN